MRELIEIHYVVLFNLFSLSYPLLFTLAIPSNSAWFDCLILFSSKSKWSKTWFTTLINHAFASNYSPSLICVWWTARSSRVTFRFSSFVLPFSLTLCELLRLKFNIDVLIVKLAIPGWWFFSPLTMALLVAFFCGAWDYSSCFTTTEFEKALICK